MLEDLSSVGVTADGFWGVWLEGEQHSTMPAGPDRKRGGGAEEYARFKQYDYRAVRSILIGRICCLGWEEMEMWLIGESNTKSTGIEFCEQFQLRDGAVFVWRVVMGELVWICGVIWLGWLIGSEAHWDGIEYLSGCLCLGELVFYVSSDWRCVMLALWSMFLVQRRPCDLYQASLQSSVGKEVLDESSSLKLIPSFDLRE